jgi:hypothetical protein
MTGILKKYQSGIISFILALYSLPVSFLVTPDYSVDGSWKRGLNLAVKNGLVFGTDFVFTYGPLGYLSTRNWHYINPLVVLAGDLFLFSGFYYFIYTQISAQKKWLVLVLITLVFLRNSYYAQNLFLIFIIYYALNLKNNFSSYFELLFCSASGLLLLFIKLNYGIVSVVLLLLMALYLLFFKSRKSFTVFVLFCGLFFCTVCLSVHIDVINYVKYGIDLIVNYDQAMAQPISPADPRFLSAMVLIAIFMGIVVLYFISLIKLKGLNLRTIISLSVFSAACFLFYKNGFTRADFVHYYDFFFVLPFFIIVVLMFCGFGSGITSKLIAGLVLAISGYVLLYSNHEIQIIKPGVTLSSLSPLSYFTEIFDKHGQPEHQSAVPYEDKLRLIGHSTVDIMTLEIALLQDNKMNYDPRPVPQTYSAYSRSLDSLNAHHFYKDNRPEYILLQSNSVDTRCEFWDESLTKAVMRLNYNYSDFLSLRKDDNLESNSGITFLILHSRPGGHTYPQFEKINEQTVNLEDTTRINFADSEAIYMTADISYSTAGKIRRLFYQPPDLSITFFFDDGTTRQYKAIGSLLQTPVLINKAVLDIVDLKNFFTGDLKKNKNVRAFAFHSQSGGFDQKMKIVFEKFSNY